jgi:hypothetical protein
MAQRTKQQIIDWLLEKHQKALDEIDPIDRLICELLLDIRENTTP